MKTTPSDSYMINVRSQMVDGIEKFRLVKPSGRIHGPLHASKEDAFTYLESHPIYHDRPHGEWVNMEEYMPGPGEAVLLFNKDGSVDLCSVVVSASPKQMIGFLEDDRFTILDVDNFCDGSISCSIQKFSHWMPLPEDPV